MQRRSVTPLEERVHQTIDAHGMLAAGDRVLVALSGGADSVGLVAIVVRLARRCGVSVAAAHFNHQLRGDESDADAATASAVAVRLGVRIRIEHASALAGPNLEARARAARYDFLVRAARDLGCTKIATGHTREDQAETVMLRLLRGSGFDGVRGIQPVRDGWIVRPLIEVSRQEVLAFVNALGLPFRTDSSNQDPRFLRNRVRQTVMPVLESLNPRVVRALATTASSTAVEASWLDSFLAQRLAAHANPRTGELALGCLEDLPLPLRARAVRLWLRTQRGTLQGLAYAHFRSILGLASSRHPSGQVQLPKGEQIRRNYGCLLWVPQSVDESSASDASGPLELDPGGQVKLPAGWVVSAGEIERCDACPLPRDLWTLVVDADAVGCPLLVRTTLPGDRIRPLGMHGHRKLQDLFVDRKVAKSRRLGYPVIEARSEILWIPGVVRSSAALVTASTRATLRVTARDTGIAGL